MNFFKRLAVAALLGVTMVGAASAAVLNIDDPTVIPAGITLTGTYTLETGCGGLGKPCADVSAGQTLTITALAGYTFDLASVGYKLAGRGDKITANWLSPAGTASVIAPPSNATTWNLGLLGLTSITFFGTNGVGAVGSQQLIDNFDLTVSAVPIPAAGVLLIGALGGLAALKRRRKVA